MAIIRHVYNKENLQNEQRGANTVHNPIKVAQTLTLRHQTGGLADERLLSSIRDEHHHFATLCTGGIVDSVTKI